MKCVAHCSQLQLPLKLALGVTIHKSQGLTLDKVVIDTGKKEFSAGLTFYKLCKFLLWLARTVHVTSSLRNFDEFLGNPLGNSLSVRSENRGTISEI